MNDNTRNDEIHTPGTPISDTPVTNTTAAGVTNTTAAGPTIRHTAPGVSKLALLTSFAAGAFAAWIIMTISNQNEDVEQQQQAQSAMMQRSRPATAAPKRNNVPRPVTH